MEDYENKVANSYATLFQNTSKFTSKTLISRIEFPIFSGKLPVKLPSLPPWVALESSTWGGPPGGLSAIEALPLHTVIVTKPQGGVLVLVLAPVLVLGRLTG